MMTLSDVPTFTMRQLLEAGVHFGHQTHRWNPKMAPFIYGARNNIHIMDLRETAPMLQRALIKVRDEVSHGGRVLFVGTKRQASAPLTAAASACGQYYVNHRWLGGMLTNWRTISNSIKRLRVLEEQLAEESSGLTKKELLRLTRERDKLERALGGIKDMGGLPAVMFVIDTNKEEIAIQEAKKLNIPVIAVVDSNCDPDLIDYPIPGNDDAARAISLYLDLVSRSVIAGLQQERQTDGEDLGAAEELPMEEIAAAEDAVAAPEAAAEPEAPAA
jgi:small subunit ribosomal protein S2|tara:strand:- start:511 stop:1332 length:822 start_codon:yes stop_codon:yes gene_type:complete